MNVHRTCRAFAVKLSLAIVLTASTSHADESAQADALFREGRKAMATADWPRAVSLLAESERLSPAPGTLLNLAIAEDQLGHLAAAWEHARAASEGLPATDDRASIARDLHAALDRRIPMLTLLPAPGFSQAATVKLDGAEIRPASFRVALPLDAGPHEIIVESPAHLRRTVVVRLAEGQRIEETLREGAPLVDSPVTRERDRPHSNASPWRSIGWVAVGTSAALVAAGSVLGGLAIDRNTTVEDHCRGRLCDQVGIDSAREGSAFATGATILFVAAGALAVAGASILFFGAH